MYTDDYCPSRGRDILETQHDVVGGEAVESGERLVGKEYGGV